MTRRSPLAPNSATAPCAGASFHSPMSRRDHGHAVLLPSPQLLAAPAQLLPDALDLQLGLRPCVLRFHRLICDDGTNSASCPHVVEHDVLRRKAAMVEQKHPDTRPEQGKNPPLPSSSTPRPRRGVRPHPQELRGLG